MKFPTDSLYKFMATFGIVLFLGAGYLSHQFDDSSKIFKMMKDQISDSTKRQDELFRKSREIVDGAREIARGNLDAGKEKASNAMIDHTRLMADNTALEQIEMLNVQTAMARNERISILLETIMFSSTLMALAGAILWYMKLQVYIDMNTKNGLFPTLEAPNELEAKGD